MKPGAAVDLSSACAHWLSERTIAWPCSKAQPSHPERFDWRLHWSPSGGIDPYEAEPVPWQSVPLGVSLTDPSDGEFIGRFPHLVDAVRLVVPGKVDVRDALRGQVVVTAHEPSGRLVAASGVQAAGVLDDLYPQAVAAQLGPTWEGAIPTLKVWAPTAQNVSLLLWAQGVPLDAQPSRLQMQRESDGCWSIVGEPQWRQARYRYEVTVFVPSFGRVVHNQVTDPYSEALAINSSHTLLIDTSDPDLVPQQWLTTPSPALEDPVDQVIYELHVRDFSMADPEVPPDLVGTYLAFTVDSLGTRHLRTLAKAGLTTVQLLPVYDFGSVEDDRALAWAPDDEVLKSLPPDSDEQQKMVASKRVRSAFNWGYDPWHHQAPEGSYATMENAGGAGRVREVRSMVGALHSMGLRVVLDQVFNHSTDQGQGVTSVLDKIVPGYYHRRDPQGQVFTSTCCPNIATEHAMAEKLMVDSVVHWARCYRVDGFRFDLMGHHSRENMLAIRAGLDALTVENDGVDGRAITMHGEGWEFGEVAGNARFVQASQGQLGGTGIATFSDRLRDAVRGGRPFDSDPREQGIGTGLLTDPNGVDGFGGRLNPREQMLHSMDLVQLGLAGTLRSYSFVSALTGQIVRGDQIDYNGLPAGYADSPDEAVNYVDAHDNETLFDALTLKLPPSVSMAERVRLNTVCLALVALGQNPVMWHAGSDFLRSKSLDRNSYNSGDWFNLLDFSLSDNGFGAGLPPADDNAERWDIMRPLLAHPGLKPSAADMREAHAHALDLLRMRRSTKLFRLGTADAINEKVKFPVSGTWAQIPGVIVMHVDDTVGEQVDPTWSGVVVVTNPAGWPVRQPVPSLRMSRWQLHPIQSESAGSLVQQAWCDDGLFSVPGRTVAVFVCER